MASAAEVFVVQLARASRRANRFVRDLQPADRQDVIAAALLWCWENRHNYSLTMTLDSWFIGAVRNARTAWEREETRTAAESISEIPTGDTTAASAAAVDAARALIRALPSEYKRVAKLEEAGYTREEMRERGIADHCITDARARIKKLRRLLPDTYEYRRALRAPVQLGSDDVTQELSAIDRELEELDFPPPAGKDCAPCWRCRWFDGWLPGSHISVRMQIIQPDVAQAISDTEAEKIRIAEEVRNGLF